MANDPWISSDSLELSYVGFGFWEGHIGALWIQATRDKNGYDSVAFVVKAASPDESDESAREAGKWLVKNSTFIHTCTFVLKGICPCTMWWKNFEMGMGVRAPWDLNIKELYFRHCGSPVRNKVVLLIKDCN